MVDGAGSSRLFRICVPEEDNKRNCLLMPSSMPACLIFFKCFSRACALGLKWGELQRGIWLPQIHLKCLLMKFEKC